MSNRLYVIAEDSDELLNAGAYGANAIIRVQSSATAGGAYTDLSGTGSTPTIPLVSGDRTYTAYDPNGTTSTWYRTRYENAGATRLSDWSAVFQVDSVPHLCSIGQVKARLWPAGPPDDADDELIDELIIQVSDYIQHYTGRRFVPENGATYTFSTTNGRSIRVPRGIRSVTSLGVNTQTHQPDTGGTYTTISAANVLLRPSTMDLPPGWPATEVRLSGAQSTWLANVENGAQITGDFGFASTPPDIQAVAIDGTVAAYQMRKNGTSGVFGADGDSGVPWWQFTMASKRTLDMYRVPGFN